MVATDSGCLFLSVFLGVGTGFLRSEGDGLSSSDDSRGSRAGSDKAGPLLVEPFEVTLAAAAAADILMLLEVQSRPRPTLHFAGRPASTNR